MFSDHLTGYKLINLLGTVVLTERLHYIIDNIHYIRLTLSMLGHNVFAKLQENLGTSHEH